MKKIITVKEMSKKYGFGINYCYQLANAEGFPMMGGGQELYDGKTIQIVIIVTQLARALNQVAMAEARILENVEKQNDEILKLLASGR